MQASDGVGDSDVDLDLPVAHQELDVSDVDLDLQASLANAALDASDVGSGSDVDLDEPVAKAVGTCALAPCSAADPEADTQYGKLRDFVNASVADTWGDRLVVGAAPHPAGSQTRTIESVLRLAYSAEAPRKCMNAGLGVATRSEAKLLVWTGLSGQQSSGLELLRVEVQGFAHQWLAITRCFDEASMYLTFPKELSSLWIQWQLEALRADRFLSGPDKAVIATALGSKRDGTAHVLCQGGTIRAQGLKNPLIFRPCVVQRTSASNVMEALDRASQVLSTSALQSQWAPFLTLLLLVFSLDRAGSNERMEREVFNALRGSPNILALFVWCFGHSVGLMSGDLLRLTDIVSPMYCLSKLLRLQAYHDTWLTHFVMVLPRSPANPGIVDIKRLAPGTFEDELRVCHDYVDWVARMTALRDFTITSRSHPLSAQADKVDQRRLDILEQLAEVKKYWHINPSKTILKVQHLCDGARVRCKCEGAV